jgi:NodT family efflux transporter outer membrane factor (OMF) lipoprotein
MPAMRDSIERLGAGLVAMLLAGCATSLPPREPPVPASPEQWQAPAPEAVGLPHDGRVAALDQWWRQFDDPLLAALVADAQAVSPTVASALSRIEQARAAQTVAGSALGPTLDAGASAARGQFDVFTPTGTQSAANLRATWEIDLFGGNRAGFDAALARLEGAQADWHDARVLVAAEVGSAYVTFRACEAQLEQVTSDAASRAETARLTTLTADAGFRAPAAADLARASAAQARVQVEAQRQRCELDVKALVALTGRDEPALRAALAAAHARLPQPVAIGVAAVPAQVLNQRPDLYAAALRVSAAAADTAQAQTRRYPRVALAGSIGPARFEGGGITASGTVWSVGPVQVVLPIFDGGALAAGVDAARARYDEAAALYAAQVRQAVREVEAALVTLQGSAARSVDARRAVEGYDASLKATEALFRGGLASLFDLEDARRTALLARRELIDLDRERVVAWIALYRALGGGWTDEAPVPVAANAR